MDIKKIAASLEQSNATISMFADGFIDEVFELVNSRTSLTDYIIMGQMKQFAERITLAGSGGMSIETIKKRRTIGGFTANIGDAAARLGVNTTMFGLYGKEKLDPLYEPLGSICRLISLGDPATVNALEFDDGKILLPHMEAVTKLCWSDIVDALGEEEIVSILSASDIVGVGYWSSMPAFDDIFAKICALIPRDNKQRRFFFDFADLRKREEACLVSSLLNLKAYNDEFPMTLSLNEHEGTIICELYGENLSEAGCPIPEKLESVREKMGLDELVIHTPQYAVAATHAGGADIISQRYCAKPVRSAGAGDTFNGGYIAGILAGLDITERLQVANAAVYYFLNNGFPPSQNDLIDELSRTL